MTVPGTGDNVEQCTAGDRVWRWKYFETQFGINF